MATKIEIPARDADRTRQAILDAAQQVFAEKGFAEAGVRDITARAGVNPSLVSRYFGGKLRSEEHTSELPSLMRNSYAVFCLKKKNNTISTTKPRLASSSTSAK